MAVWQYLCRRLWVIALVAMVAFVAIDTIIHLRTTYSVSTQHLFTPPVADPNSPTGYVLGQRDEILPYVGMDGYHWVMQTQAMMAAGDLRVRWVDYDNYTAQQPSGREVHWSSSFRWWVTALAWIDHLYAGVPLPWTVEDVVPFANTVLIVLMIVMLAPAMVRRFGSGLGGMLIIAMAAIGPMYESFSEGKSDHHGLASLSAMLTLLFLVGGAAGWVRTDGGEAPRIAMNAWLPTRRQARLWFIVSNLLLAAGIALAAAWKSTTWTGGLIGVAAVNCLLTLTLWADARSISLVSAPSPTADPAPTSATVETSPDGAAMFAWLPAPSFSMARKFFLGSAIFGAGAVLFLSIQYVAYNSLSRTDSHHLPFSVNVGLSAALFTVALLNIILAILLLLKSANSLTAQDKSKEDSSGPKLLAWLPSPRQARLWFIASGIAGGVGLWVSTASEAPVLAEVGMGALLATGLLARGANKESSIQADPSLWRIWGWSGAATSIFFYLLEYFPSHMGMRLEVNHPLYAFAWAGGGEILFRLCRWWGGAKLAERPSDWAWLGGSVFAVVIVPLIIFKFADQVFWIASWTSNSRFLFIFHEDYIAEFKDMRRYLGAMYAGGSAGYTIAVVNPLILLALPMLAWTWRSLRKLVLGALGIGLPFYAVLRLMLWAFPLTHEKFPLPSIFLLFAVGPAVAALALVCLLRPAWEKLILLVMLAGGLLIYVAFLLLFNHFMFQQTEFPGDYYAWVFLAVPLIIFVCLLLIWEPWKNLPRPCQALMALALPGGTLTTILSLREMRWMEIGYAFWIAALIGVILALRLHDAYRWTWARRLGLFLASVLLPSPVLTLMDWARWHLDVPMSDVEVMELVTRDAAQRLRAQIGSDTGVVVSGPTTTTWMTYWGGFKGLGTLYWENLGGLKADMAIYSARTEKEALDLIKKYGVTHIAIFSWDPFYKEYARLSKEMHRPVLESEYEAEKPLRHWITYLQDAAKSKGWGNVVGKLFEQFNGDFADPEAEKPKLQDAFIYSLIEGQRVPPWLRFIPYSMPGDQALRGQYISMYEVVPNQAPEVAVVRLAQGQMVLGNFISAEQNLNILVGVKPDYLPGLVCFARVENLLASNPPQGVTDANRQGYVASRINNFNILVQKIKSNLAQADQLAFADRLELAIALVLANDPDDARLQIMACMQNVQLRELRQLSAEQLYNFLSFLRQMNLLDARPGLEPLLLNLLPQIQRVQFILELAAAEKQAGHWSAQLALLRRAVDQQPNSVPATTELARLLATGHDASLRNGREALSLALQAHQLDLGQHADVLDVLACSYAEAGQFALAESTEKLALNAAEAAKNAALNESERAKVVLIVNQFGARLLAFHNQQPYHE